MKMKLIKGGKNRELMLEQAREKLGERLEAFTPVMDKIFIEFGIPMQYATKNWESFMMGLDQLLCEHFSWEPDEEDK